MSSQIQVEVAYALPAKQRIVKLKVPEGTTAMQAVQQSQLDTVFEELSIDANLKLGVWGKSVAADRVLEEGERVEIYRPCWWIRRRCARRAPRRPKARVPRAIRPRT